LGIAAFQLRRVIVNPASNGPSIPQFLHTNCDGVTPQLDCIIAGLARYASAPHYRI
jgi:hypothetical protein